MVSRVLWAEFLSRIFGGIVMTRKHYCCLDLINVLGRNVVLVLYEDCCKWWVEKETFTLFYGDPNFIGKLREALWLLRRVVK